MKYAGLIVICGLFGSCLNDGNCLITATNNMHLQFKTKRNKKIDTALYFRQIHISGAGDTGLFKHDTLVSELLLPVDIHSDTTQFIFQYVNAPADTLQVGYTTQSKVIAKDCGAFTYYQNLKVDSINTSLANSRIKVFNTSLLKDPTIGNTPSAYAVNYQIFY